MKIITDIKDFLKGVTDGDKIHDVICEATKNPTAGKRVVNDNCYVNVVECLPNAKDFDGVFEFHERYADVQYLISGSEKLYYGEKSGMTVVRGYDEIADIGFLQGDNYAAVTYAAGQAALLEAGEPHAPGYIAETNESIIKAVIKIKTENKEA